MIEHFIFTISLLLTTLITLLLTFISWRRKSTGNHALYFAICSLTVAIYAFGYAMEIQSETLETAMFWVRFQHWGIEFIAPAWLLFSLSVSGNEKRISKKIIIFLLVVSIILLLISQTLGTLNLGHINPRMDTSGAFTIFTYDRGLYNYISLGFYSICLTASTIVFLLMLFRSAPSFKKQAVIYLIGSVIPWIALIIYSLSLISSNLDFTPIALGISEIIFAFGFIKFGILDIIPLARDTIFENMNNGVLILDMDGRILDFNPALQNIFPEIQKNDVGVTLDIVFSEHPMLINLIEIGQSERIEYQIGKNGDSSFYRINQSFILNNGKFNGKIVSFYEYTSEKKLLNKLEKLATTDSLTGIFNRQHFDELVQKEISRLNRYGGKLSLIMFDLDHFKAINDTYGHIAGDKALTTVCNTFQHMLRETDIMSRFGGEEFLILTPNTGISEAKILAERLRQRLTDIKIQIDDQDLHVRASFGIASITPGEKITLEKFYKMADQATYKAKALGGNRVCIGTAPKTECETTAENLNS